MSDEIPDYESIKDVIVWRCISMKTFSGGMSGFPRTEYVYDDYVLATRLGEYLQEITDRGNVTKMTLHRIGKFATTFAATTMKYRSGTTQISKQKNIPKLETFI